MSRSRLPPLSSLRAFEAAARRASFKAAAEELSVTPTAISHQIKQLEAHMGLRVLDRSPRAVTLTPQGKTLYEATASGFGEIERAVTRLLADTTPTTVTLSSTTAFLSHWLVPRMDTLRLAVPMIDLRLHTSNSVEDLRAGGVETAIRYGRGPFPGVISTRLCDDVMTPVCSSRLGLSHLDDLRHAILIHIDGRNRPTPEPDWLRWCAQAGVADVDTSVGPRFPDSMLAVQAAIAGQGVVIASRVLVADALAAGLLIAPFSGELAGDAYHFACAIGLETRADIVALREWFQASLGPMCH
ncbi:LysR family transcriptional regulator (plasmid) [Rhizobium rhizogenes]|uniref:LysR family transcriptional regulator n=4 Tax=Rhizobium/Agrobacterium group TaxID=227290 RepID=A0A2Z2PM08_AGRTU|nr:MULTISPECIES: LysR substrate-binding domain-containing protein [Rhizobium/Agrobacterium group]ACM31053.1 LysR family transcriptional regulator [Rhizobium rhizogenes K84]ASK43743.1 LysR family transcriptional regulator [Agrobacterium radiobacter]ASK43873.1 LysR family transcriptional regulator [Rhizobium rhizogenes]AYM84795.1 LysR family transcriptional regulator, glycine cleavage system transcriptional activator [Agrobacterium tumefaciens]MBF2712813.1 LysR family transcriptional regulator [